MESINSIQDFAKLLSCSQISKIYKVSRNSVYLSAKNNRINSVNTRNGWLIDKNSAALLWNKRQ